MCFYVTVDNHPWTYLFDCGMARRLGAGDCKSLRCLFITHTHVDHFSNFDTVLRNQLGLNRTVTICGPAGIAKNVQARALSYTWNLIRRRAVVYEIRELDEDGMTRWELYPPRWELRRIERVKLTDNECFRDNGISVRYELLDHKIPSVAYRMEEDSTVNIGDFDWAPGPWIRELKEAYDTGDRERMIEVEPGVTKSSGELFSLLFVKQGKSFGFAMDHVPSPENHKKLVRLWKDATTAVIEGYFRECDRPYALRHYHSTVKDSGRVAREAGVERLILTHHSRRYFSELEDMLEEGYAEFEQREPRFREQPVSRYSEGDDEFTG